MKSQTIEILEGSELFAQLDKLWYKAASFNGKKDAYSDLDLFSFYNNMVIEASKKRFFNDLNFEINVNFLKITPKKENKLNEWNLKSLSIYIKPFYDGIPSNLAECIEHITLVKNINNKLTVEYTFGGNIKSYSYNDIEIKDNTGYTSSFYFHCDDSENVEINVREDLSNDFFKQDEDCEALQLYNLLKPLEVKENSLINKNIEEFIFQSKKLNQEQIDLLLIEEDIDLNPLKNFKEIFLNLNSFDIDNASQLQDIISKSKGLKRK